MGRPACICRFVILIIGGFILQCPPVSAESTAISVSAKPDHASRNAGELAERIRISKRVAHLLVRSDFAALEKLANRYRNRKERSPSGLWKLTHFYGGIKRFFHAAIVKDYAPNDRLAQRDMAATLHARTIDNWKIAYPDSPTPYLAYVMMLKHQAWGIRGSGKARSVKRGAWAPFHAKLRDALLYLEDNRKRASIDPHWYALRVHIGLEIGEEADKLLAIADEGLDQEPYYYPIYFATVRLMLPQWNGPSHYIDAFANSAGHLELPAILV